MSTRTTSTYRCTECGWTTAKWVGRCGECQTWGTVVDAGTTVGISPQLTASTILEARRARPLSEVTFESAHHVPTSIGEFDRVLGGGVAQGSCILLSGEPGVGKSTLLLEVAARAAETETVLYVTAEESVGQVSLRARRIGAASDSVLVAAETELSAVLGQIEATKPDLVIVDSVQTVSSDAVDGIPGGPTQVKTVAGALTKMAKSTGFSLILVGHVTKDGTIAGPRTLEHLVDVVCQFEGDRNSSLRFVRSIKNRFGSTDEVGCFEMTGEGIAEVPDPSGLFMSRTEEPVSGTCVTIALEGKRSFPVEVQALVVPTNAPQARRITNGVDGSRVAMILAVLERRVGLPTANKDVYISTVGGIKLSEPASDLAIALAVVSAVSGVPFLHTLAVTGEISLSGQIRPALGQERRLAEAARLGFTSVIDSGSSTLSNAVRRARTLSSTNQLLEEELHAVARDFAQ